MSAPNKKPTMMEMKNVVSNIINKIDMLDNHVSQIDFLLARYFDFKSDKENFQNWLKENAPKDEEILDEKRENKNSKK